MLYVKAETMTENGPKETYQTENSIAISDAAGMAQHLRQEFGIAKAVYLSQIAQQLSQSFASNEQLQQQWKQALATEIIEPTHFTQINTHALMAQTLVQYTNGMTLDRFRQVNLPLTPKFRSLNDPYVRSRTFQTWLNLTYHWQNILEKGGQENMAQWLAWLQKSPVSSTNKTLPNNSLNPVLTIINKTNFEDVDQLNKALSEVNYFTPLAVALMRQKLHLTQKQTIALGYDWIEIYQLLELNNDLLTADQQQDENSKRYQIDFWHLFSELFLVPLGSVSRRQSNLTNCPQQHSIPAKAGTTNIITNKSLSSSVRVGQAVPDASNCWGLQSNYFF